MALRRTKAIRGKHIAIHQPEAQARVGSSAFRASVCQGRSFRFAQGSSHKTSYVPVSTPAQHWQSQWHSRGSLQVRMLDCKTRPLALRVTVKGALFPPPAHTVTGLPLAVRHFSSAALALAASAADLVGQACAIPTLVRIWPPRERHELFR
jgi:hypothetical protein